MSEIAVDTIMNSAGTHERFPCTAWVNFNGTGTVAIRDSGNVSSITDVGVGNYTVNFTTNLDNTNYAAVINPSAAQSGTLNLSGGIYVGGGDKTVSDVAILIETSAGTDTDPVHANVLIFGGLA